MQQEKLLKTKLYLERKIRTNAKKLSSFLDDIFRLEREIREESDYPAQESLKDKLLDAEENWRHLHNENVFLKTRSRRIKEQLINV